VSDAGKKQNHYEKSVVTLEKKVKVTYHRLDLFRTIYSDFFSTFEELHKSLSPKYNRDMVFKAGEGAGRSG